MEYEYGIFLQDGKGPLRVESLNDFPEAKQKAQEIADKTKIECFVYSFKTFSEQYRGYPRNGKAKS